MIHTQIVSPAQLSPVPEALVRLVSDQLTEDGFTPGLEACQERVKAAAKSANTRFLLLYDMPDDMTDDTNCAEMDDGTELIVSAEAELLGFAFFNICFGLETGGSYIWLNELHVGADHRGLGYGKLMLRELEDWSRSQGMVYQACLTGSDNSKAQAMYRSNGFEISPVLWVEKEL